MKGLRNLALWLGLVAVTRSENDSLSGGDLLDHPAIRCMSPRELADLPFQRMREGGRLP
jgi:hypothetical protein